jgi:hypothetical protein
MKRNKQSNLEDGMSQPAIDSGKEELPPDLSNKMTKLIINPDHSWCTVDEKVG